MAKNGMFSFKAFLLFWERVARERVAENEGILARKKQLLQLVLVLAKYGKISNAQVAGLVVTAVLKKLSQLSGKICDSYPKTTVCFGQKQMGSVR